MRPQSRTSSLRIDGESVDGVEAFAHRFVQSRVRVDGVHHRLDRCFSFHRGYALADELEGLRPDDVDAEDLAVLRVGNDLDEAGVVAEDGSLAVAHEGELADLYVQTLRLGLRFGETDAADAGLGVGGAGD